MIDILYKFSWDTIKFDFHGLHDRGVDCRSGVCYFQHHQSPFSYMDEGFLDLPDCLPAGDRTALLSTVCSQERGWSGDAFRQTDEGLNSVGIRFFKTATTLVAVFFCAESRRGRQC